MPTLYLLQGADKGHSFDVTDSPAIIGRNSPDVPLTDNTVSRRHAELTRKDDDVWTIHDLNSANGTLVNGVKLSGSLELKQGDQIRCGTTLIVFGDVRSNTIQGDLGGLHIDEDGNLVESSIMSTMPTMDDSVLLAGPDVSDAAGNLRVLYELTTAISTIFDRQQLLETVMDIIFDNLPTDRGFILLRENDQEQLSPVVVRYRSEDHSGEITVSHTIVDYAIEKKEGVICTNAMRDPRFEKGESVQNYGIRSALCVPITVRDNIMGVIYVDTTVSTNTYASEQLRLLTAIGFQTGLAIEHSRLYQAGVKAERLAATGQTVAYISHGIKNILQSLQSAGDMVELGLNKKDIDTAEKGWAILQRNLTRIQNLVLNMLAYSKARQPNLAMTQLNSLVTDLINMLSSQAIEKRVGLFSDLDDNMPPIAIDDEGMQQAILNLMLNAFDAIEPGNGAITIKTEFDPANHQAILTVTDNGVGIAANEQGDIFMAFQSSKGQGGTGLGLAVVKKTVEEHHGQLTVDSAPGEGTSFIIKIPTDIEITDSSTTAFKI